jgi:hypothetical protein
MNTYITDSIKRKTRANKAGVVSYVEKTKGLLHMSGAGERPQLHLGQGFADADHGFQLK